MEKGKTAQTVQIRPCLPRPQDPALPETRQANQRRRQRAQRRKQERKPNHGQRRPTTRPTSTSRPIFFPPIRKSLPASEPVPISFSIKDSMNSLGSKLVISSIPKPSNKGNPDTAYVPSPGKVIFYKY